jgi:hypothetical protein
MDGFDGEAHLDPEDDFEFAVGEVIGLRWWTLVKPPRDCRPREADSKWPVKALTGSYGGAWQSGRNEAVCLRYGRPSADSEHKIPWEPCGCGYWAYWDLQSHGASEIRVCGVVKGTGRTLIGTKGFRSQYAEIIALHVPMQDLAYRQWNREKPPEKSLDDLVNAWMAVIGDRVAQMYPTAAIYETQRMMLADHPLDMSYKNLLPPLPPLPPPSPVTLVGGSRISVSRDFLCTDPSSHQLGCTCKVPWVSPPPQEDISLTGDGSSIIISSGNLCVDTQNHRSNCFCIISGLPPAI